MNDQPWHNWLKQLARCLQRYAPPKPLVRLEVEMLEDRLTPTTANNLVQPTYQMLSTALTSLTGPALAPAGLNPTQIRNAYGFNQLLFPGNVAANGSGQTIAIVDAFDDPTAASDLTAFDQQFGLASPTLVKVGINAGGQASTSVFPTPNQDWSLEIALDIEWAHAIAPAARILLVEANSNSWADLLRAVDYARNSAGVSTISMSWGGSEMASEGTFDSHFTTPAGHTPITFFASSGDNGAPALAPAVSAHVVAVGGTSLNVDAAGDWLGETAWSGSGGGISSYVSQPSYQDGLAIFGGNAFGMRAAPDVSFDADPYTGVAVLASYGYGGWLQVGGTSAAAPQWAGLIAITDQGRALFGKTTLDGYTQTLPEIYSLPDADFHDIVAGSNGFSAGPGYDLATGRGSPVANFLIPDLIGVPQVLTFIRVTPAALTVGDGNPLQLTAVAVDQFGKPMSTQPAFTWSLVNGSGTLTDAGLYTAPAAGVGADVVTVSATIGGITVSASDTLAFQPGPSITQLGADPTVVTGVSTTLSADVTDLDPASLTYSWWVVSMPAGATAPFLVAPNSASTLEVFQQAGAYAFGFSATDGAGVSATGVVDVTVVSTFTSVGMTPTTVTVADGGQQQFVAKARDQFGNPLAVQPTFAWSVGSGSGSIDASGLYTAPAAGAGNDTVGATTTVAGVTVSGNAAVTFAVGFGVASISASSGVVTGTTITVSASVVNPGDGYVGYFWYGWNDDQDAVGALFMNPGSASSSVVFFAPGEYTLSITAYDLKGDMASATVNVTVVSTATLVEVSPLVSYVPLGSQQQFSAQVLDQFYNPMPGSFTWNVTKGPGTVDASGLYTAPSAGSGVIYVQASTAVDGVTVSGLGIVILRPAPTITAISATPTAINKTTLSASAFDLGGGSDSYQWTALASPAGAMQPTIADPASASTTATFFQAGTYTFQVAVSNPTGTTLATIDVTIAQVLTSIAVSAPASVPDGVPQQLSATAFDQFHQAMPAAVVWSKLSGPGSIDSTTGTFTPPATGTGSAVVKASVTANGVTLSRTVSLTLLAPPTISAVSAAMVTASKASVKVVASNPGGGTLTYQWSVIAQPAGAPAPVIAAASASSASVTFFHVGVYTFRVLVTNKNGSTSAANMTLTVKPVLTSIILTPATTTVMDGASQAFNAAAYDQFQQLLAATFKWSLTRGAGSLNASTGLYTAPKSYTGTTVITAVATVNGITLHQSATLTVVVPGTSI